jgi:hypothetical protein
MFFGDLWHRKSRRLSEVLAQSRSPDAQWLSLLGDPDVRSFDVSQNSRRSVVPALAGCIDVWPLSYP